MNNKDVRSFCAMASTMFRYYNACDGITNVFLNWFTGQDSPGGKVVLEGKCRAKCATNVHELSQCFATAITFSSIQQRRHPTVHCFPTIRISPRGFDIILYNPEFDLLLICCLGWTRKALLILWIVEHYHLFPVTQAFLKENRMHPLCSELSIPGAGRRRSGWSWALGTRICVGYQFEMAEANVLKTFLAARKDLHFIKLTPFSTVGSFSEVRFRGSR